MRAIIAITFGRAIIQVKYNGTASSQCQISEVCCAWDKQGKWIAEEH